MPEVTIAPVTTRSEMKAFIDLPWGIYPRECNWVPPLKKMVRHLLDPKKHPFWKLAERELFLAMRGSRVVGRIAAIVDHNYNRCHDEKMGAWGFFECFDDPDAAAALFDCAARWTAARGMTFLRGPLNPSTNYDVGMLIDGYQYPPTIMMTWNHPYYVRLVEGAGFTKEKDLFALKITHEDRIGSRLERLAKRIERTGKLWSRNGSRKNMESEMTLMAGIYRSAWADNWGFVPITDDEAKEMAKNLVQATDEELAYFIYSGDEAAAFVMVMFDLNPLMKRFNGKIGLSGPFKYLLYRKEVRGLRAILFGVKKEYQKRGLPLVAFNHLYRVLKDNRKYDYLEFGWTLEDNEGINKLLLEMGATIWKRYRIFRRPLEAASS